MTSFRSIVRIIARLLCLAVMLTEPEYALAEGDPLRQGYALLIGVWDYADSRWSRLDDVKLQIEQLKAGLASNFDHIETLDNPTFTQLDEGLRSFLRTHGNEPDARLFIYYAGHGYTELDRMRNENRGFITSSDTPYVDKNEASLSKARPKAVSMEAVRAMVSDINARQVLFMFDSCFSGSVFSARSPVQSTPHLSTEDIAKRLTLPVREFITAGDDHEVIPAKSPIPGLFLNAIGGDADTYHTGVITARQVTDYLWLQTRSLGINITPREGKLPGPYFDRGEFLFRTGLPIARSESVEAHERLDTPTAFPMQATAECFRRAKAEETAQETIRAMHIAAAEKAQVAASYKDFPSDCAPSLHALQRLNACLVEAGDMLINDLEELNSAIPGVVRPDTAFCRATQQLDTSELLARAQRLKTAEQALKVLSGRVQSCNSRIKNWLSEKSTTISSPVWDFLRRGINEQIDESVLQQEEQINKLSTGIKKDDGDLNYVVQSRLAYCGG